MLERAMQYADIQLTSDVREAVQNADIVYTDVFISMGDAESEEKKRVLRRYRVTEELMSLAKPDALFMHCMPVHRGEEVTEEVLDGPQSIVYERGKPPAPQQAAPRAAREINVHSRKSFSCRRKTIGLKERSFGPLF